MSLIFTGYWHVKLLTKVDSRGRSNINPAVQYEKKVIDENSLNVQEPLRLQENDYCLYGHDNINPVSKIQLIYFHRTK